MAGLLHLAQFAIHGPTHHSLAILSGHLGRDFSLDDLDAPMARFQASGSQGVLAMYGAPEGAAPSLAEVASWHGGSVGLPPVAGTPEQVADWFEAFIADSGGDGFMLSPYHSPGAVTEFVDLVVPVLQARGRFRSGYTGGTLREHLLQEVAG